MEKLIKNCKNVSQIRNMVVSYFKRNNITDKYSKYLINNLNKQTDFNKSLQLVYNYILNQYYPTKNHDTGYVPYKGTSIGGMECHSSGHR